MKELPSPVEHIDMAGENQKAKTENAKTLYDKLWDDHLVKQRDDGSALLYIDRHLLHEVTSPQAFAIGRSYTLAFKCQRGNT